MIVRCSNKEGICQKAEFRCVATFDFVKMVLATVQGCCILCLAFIGSKFAFGASEHLDDGSFARRKLSDWRGIDVFASDPSVGRKWTNAALRPTSLSAAIPPHALLRMHRQIQRRKAAARGVHNARKRSTDGNGFIPAEHSVDDPALGRANPHSLHKPDLSFPSYPGGRVKSVPSETDRDDWLKKARAVDAPHVDHNRIEPELVAVSRDQRNESVAHKQTEIPHVQNETGLEADALFTVNEISPYSLLRFLRQLLLSDDNSTGVSDLVDQIPPDVLRAIILWDESSPESNHPIPARLQQWLGVLTRQHRHTRRGAPDRRYSNFMSLSDLLKQQGTQSSMGDVNQTAPALPHAPSSFRQPLDPLSQYLSQSKTKTEFGYTAGIGKAASGDRNTIYHKPGGTTLRMLTDGTVDFVRDIDIYCVVLVKPVEQRGQVIVKIRGEKSGQYLGMREDGSLYGTANANDPNTSFVHVYVAQSHDAYRSVRHSTYVARTAEGRQTRRVVRTDDDEQAEFLVLKIGSSRLHRLRQSEMPRVASSPQATASRSPHAPANVDQSSVSPSLSIPAEVSDAPATEVTTPVTTATSVPQRPRKSGSKMGRKRRRKKKCRRSRKIRKCRKRKRNRKCVKRKKRCKRRGRRKQKAKNRVHRSVDADALRSGSKYRSNSKGQTMQLREQRQKRNSRRIMQRNVAAHHRKLSRVLFGKIQKYLRTRMSSLT